MRTEIVTWLWTHHLQRRRRWRRGSVGAILRGAVREVVEFSVLFLARSRRFFARSGHPTPCDRDKNNIAHWDGNNLKSIQSNCVIVNCDPKQTWRAEGGGGLPQYSPPHGPHLYCLYFCVLCKDLEIELEQLHNYSNNSINYCMFFATLYRIGLGIPSIYRRSLKNSEKRGFSVSAIH